MGSEAKSVPLSVLPRAIRSVFEAVQPAGLRIATCVVLLPELKEVWDKSTGNPRGFQGDPVANLRMTCGD